MSEVKQVADWIDAAKQEKTLRNTANYLGYLLSEVAETLQETNSTQLVQLSTSLEYASRKLRSGDWDFALKKCNNVKIMDGAIDSAWCAIGLAHMLGDAQGAFAEVVRSNYSKFEGGVCSLDETGKVIKGPSYTEPSLAKFVKLGQD